MGLVRQVRSPAAAVPLLSTSKAPGFAPASVEGGEKQASNAVETIGEKTFYWKNNRWQDADVTAQGEKKLVHIKAFSPEYFALAARNNGRFAKYLALDGPILVTLEGKTYLIESAAGG